VQVVICEMAGKKSLTERVIVCLSEEQLQKVDEYCDAHGEDRSGFIRRIVLRELNEAEAD